MTRFALTGAQILADDVMLSDHALIIVSGQIEAVVPEDAISEMPVHRLEGGILLPGFIDTQVNGGGGVLFNDAPTLDGIAAIAAAHRFFGTTAMLPTLISDDLAVVERAITAVDEAIEQGVPGIVGIHIEGPFLNPGKKGIHDAGKFRRLDPAAIDLLSSLKLGRTLVTLAPELAPDSAISALVERGVTVAAGHTLASYEEMEGAVAEGLSATTHLFNAMTQFESRAPGVVGAAFDFNLTSGIIVDGFHVHPTSLRLAYRMLGPDRLMLVTDAMPATGPSGAGAQNFFYLGDTKISVKDGALRGPDGTLAGSALDMASALRNAMEMMGVTLAEASKMASVTPARFLGLGQRKGRIAVGFDADLIHLNDELIVQQSWIAGKTA